jgi:hypothetical protein
MVTAIDFVVPHEPSMDRQAVEVISSDRYPFD